MLIRQERPADRGQVYELIKAAFATAEHADGNEQDLVEALRQGEAFVPELSLVAETEDGIVGHILFTKAEAGGETVLALAPLSVRPGWQRRGVGSALMAEGHRRARELGYGFPRCSAARSTTRAQATYRRRSLASPPRMAYWRKT